MAHLAPRARLVLAVEMQMRARLCQHDLRVKGGRADQITEAKALRPHHNLTPANCIEATAIALRATVPAPDFDHLLAAIGTGAQDFWRVPPAKLRTVTFPG